jgi:hypothetical protein
MVSRETAEVADRVAGCSGLWTGDMVQISRLFHEDGPCRKIHNRWNNRKRIKYIVTKKKKEK